MKNPGVLGLGTTHSPNAASRKRIPTEAQRSQRRTQNHCNAQQFTTKAQRRTRIPMNYRRMRLGRARLPPRRFFSPPLARQEPPPGFRVHRRLGGRGSIDPPVEAGD